MAHPQPLAARWAGWPLALLVATGSPPAAADIEAPDFIAWGAISGWFRTGTNGGFGIECLQNGRNFSIEGPAELLDGASDCSGLKTANALGRATARVTLNSVGASTYLAQGPELRTSTDSSVTASASISSGIVVRPKPGVTPTPLVEVSLPFNLSGSLAVSGPAPHHLFGAGGESLSTVYVSVTLGGHTFTDSSAAKFPAFEPGFPADDPNSSMLESGSTPTIKLPIDTRQTFEVALWAKSEVVASGYASGYFTSSVSYGHTLTFGHAGAVFRVPEGYTVDAPGLGIVDNHYVGAVPEPGSAALWAAGLGLFALGSLADRVRRARPRAASQVSATPLICA